MIGFLTLFEKEFLRFWKVSFQTVAAPVLTALLYLLIFGHVLDDSVQVHGVRYTSFLVPGLVMMQVLQNAFANSSSSLIQAKITGSIVFVLLPQFPTVFSLLLMCWQRSFVVFSSVLGFWLRPYGLPILVSSHRCGC